MPTTLGEELKRLIPEKTSQKAMAMAWLDALKKRKPEQSLSPDTAESRLSQCLKNLPEGVKFFFGEPERRDATFEAFGMTDEDRERLRRLAEEVLATERPVRFVLDATTWPQGGAAVEAMFDAIKERFLDEAALLPMALVLTAKQYDKLPRSWDERSSLVVKKVDNRTPARAVVDELAGSTALVAAPYPRAPFERWMAVHLDKGIEIGPADAIERFREAGALPGLPPVTMPLTKVAQAQSQSPELPESHPLKVRELMLALARGDEIYSDQSWGRRLAEPGVRLSWAQRLGIIASATRSEWTAGLPARIRPVELWEDNGVWLRHLLWLGRYTPIAPVALQVGDALHVINPPDSVRDELEGAGSVQFYSLVPDRTPTLERMLSEAHGLTEEDLLDDPFLEKLVERHISDEADHDALSFARAALLVSGVLKPARSPRVGDVRLAMTALLKETALEASLALHAIDPAVKAGEREWSTFVAPSAIVDRAKKQSTAEIINASPLAPVTVRRSEDLMWFGISPADWRGYSTDAPSLAAVSVQVPVLSGPPSTWANQILQGAQPTGDRYRRTVAAPPIKLPSWRQSSITISDEQWKLADRQLVFVLAALRASIATSPILPVHGGTALLALGNGIFAELDVREHPASAACGSEVALVQKIRVNKAGLEVMPLTHLVPTHGAETSGYAKATTEMGFQLPVAVQFVGRGYWAKVTFQASPLFIGLGPSSALFEAAASGASAMLDAKKLADEEEERRRS